MRVCACKYVCVCVCASVPASHIQMISKLRHPSVCVCAPPYVNVAYDGAVLGYTARRIIILMLFGWELLLPHQAFLHCDLVVVLESIVCNGWLEHIFIWIHNVYVYVVYYICFV